MHRPLTLIPIALLLLFALAACRDAPPPTEPTPQDPAAAAPEGPPTAATEPAPEEPPAAATEPAPEESPAAAAEAVPEEPPATTAEAAPEEPEPSPPGHPAGTTGDDGLATVLTDDTVWQDVVDGLSEGEQSCIRDALADEDLAALLATPILEADVPPPWEVSIFTCLDPEIARALFVAVIVAGMEADEGVELSGEEESCLRAWASAVDIAALIAVAAVDDSAAAAEFMPGVVQCIPDLLLGTMLLESGVSIDKLSENEAACLRTWLVDLDWASLMAGLGADDAAAAVEFATGMFSCAPSLFVSAMILDSGLELEELSEEEAACLRGWAAETDWAAVMIAYAAADVAGLSDVMPGLMRCLPFVFVSAMIADLSAGMETLNEEQATCVREWAGAADWSGVWAAYSADDPTLLGQFLPGLIECVPQLLIPVTSAGADPPGPARDAAIEEPTAVVVGQAVSGALDYPGDVDVFAVELEAGRLYQIDVALGTLADSALTLYDGDEARLASNDDAAAGTLASRLYWPAASSGRHYLTVSGYGGEGSYTLTAVLSDIADDHANSFAGASAAVVGAAAAGTLDYPGDVDVFVVELEAGQFYQVDVTLGTLSDSYLTLYAGDGEWLAFNDDVAGTLASRLYWRAVGSGRHYLAVSGYGDGGSYTLTAALSDIADDHADSFAEATPAAVGEAAPGALDYPGDVDVFVVELEAGQLYQIDVALGTLAESVLTLYDGDEAWLAPNDEMAGPLASRRYLRAASSGPHYLTVSGGGEGSYTLTAALSDIADDHADSFAEATPAAVGEAAPGALDYPGDVDVFAVELAAGQLYQVDVALGTLADSVLTLYDGDETWLASNDDVAGTLASRLYWRAVSSGRHYLAISGYGDGGSYTLTAALSDIADDHADSFAEATPAVVGEAAPGTLDYPGDVDVFVVELEAGQLYQIDVTLGTLGDSVLTLFVADGDALLASNDDHGGSAASRLYWEATSSDRYFLEVASFGALGEGTYTLTVIVR